MRGFFFLLCIIAGLLPSAAFAQQTLTFRCDSNDIDNRSTTFGLVAGRCEITTGPLGLIFVFADSYANCTGTESAQLVIGPGTAPYATTDFQGTVAGGVLTIPQYIPPTWYNYYVPGPRNGMVDGFGPRATNNLMTQSTTIGGGVDPILWVQLGQVLTGDVTTGTMVQGVTIVKQLTSTQNGLDVPGQTQLGSTTPNGSVPGLYAGAFGGSGTYQVSSSTATMENSGNGFFAYSPMPTTAVPISRVMAFNSCNIGQATNAITGVYHGFPNFKYWIAVAIHTDVALHVSQWDNARMSIFTY